MRVAAYIRVSTEEQVKEGYSLEAQRDRLINFCKSQDGWELVDIYPEEGKSAKDLKRPELTRMLTGAQNGLYDVILVYKLDRLTRSVSDLYELLKMFEAYGVKFKSATEVYDTTTAMGKLFITIVAALAQWERENLSERVRFGMEEVVREGKWHGGPVPFGYFWKDGEMKIVSEEFDTLRLLRDIYMSGEGFRGTARSLNAKEQFRRGEEWSAQSVWYTLDNPIYAGRMRYGEKKKNGKYATRKKEELVNVIWADTGFPTIYTWDEYEEHKARMKRKEFTGHSKKREYVFSGVLRCARCGATLIGRPYYNKKADGTKTAPYYNYICSNRSLGKKCDLPLLRQSVAERIILKRLEVIKLGQQEILDASEQDIKKYNTIMDERKVLNKDLKEIAARRKKWQYMFANELISEKDLRERKTEEEEREAAIYVRLEELEAYGSGTSVEKLKMLFDLPMLWDTLDDLRKREMLQTVFKNIIIECEVKSGKGNAKKGSELPFIIKEVEFN